jgi:hypothetical protein
MPSPLPSGIRDGQASAHGSSSRWEILADVSHSTKAHLHLTIFMSGVHYCTLILVWLYAGSTLSLGEATVCPECCLSEGYPGCRRTW